MLEIDKNTQNYVLNMMKAEGLYKIEQQPTANPNQFGDTKPEPETKPAETSETTKPNGLIDLVA